MIDPLQSLYRIDERHGGRGAIECPEAEAKQWNTNGYGIFLTANAFRKDITTEEHIKNKTKTNRSSLYLTRLLFAFCDFDIAKEGETLTAQERFMRKDRIWEAIWNDCPAIPDAVIDTKNGFQPLWKVDAEPTERNIRDYTKFINGMIAWGKGYGSFGDPVKDTSRLIRAPGFYHMKSDPYMVSIVHT